MSVYPDLPATIALQAQRAATLDRITVVTALPQGERGEPGPQGEVGSFWLTGEGAPDAGSGRTSDLYLDRTTGDFYSKSTGTWVLAGTLVGPTGSPGPLGSQWYIGSGAPIPQLGQGGDVYLDETSGDVWYRTVEGWGLGGNIRGPQGDVGPQGETGAALSINGTVADGPPPVTGSEQTGDAWISLDDGHLWVWGDSGWVDCGPVQGPQGPPGGSISVVTDLALVANGAYATQTVTHSLDNPYPIVRVLVPNGGGHLVAETSVGVAYLSATQVEISALSSFTSVVGGKVVLS